MPIQYVTGDLLWGSDDVVVHGCNCFHKMHKGIANQIRLTYPGAYRADLATKLGDEKKLGTFSSWTGKHIKLDKAVTVINAYVQFEYGNYGRYLNDKALHDALARVNIETGQDMSIGLPKIGAGLAGADWSEVEIIINEVFHDRTVTVYSLRSSRP